MDWLNLHIPSVLRSPEYIGSSAEERGTWTSVMGYACEIECAGVLLGAAAWKDRQWQQACGVTLREVRASTRLLRFVGDDLHVNAYPVAMEKQVKEGRKYAKAGAMARWGKKGAIADAGGHAGGHEGNDALPMPPGDAKGEGKGKGKGKGKEKSKEKGNHASGAMEHRPDAQPNATRLKAIFNSSHPPRPAPSQKRGTGEVWFLGLRPGEQSFIENAVYIDKGSQESFLRDLDAIHQMVSGYGLDCVVSKGNGLRVHGKPPFPSRLREALESA